MPRPRTGSLERSTVDRLLEAAEREFGLNGPTAGRLDEIAREVGISRPSLLYHFPTKADLYAAVVARTFERMGLALAAPLASQAPARERMLGVVQAFAAHLAANPSVARLLLHEVISGDGPGADLLADRATLLLQALEQLLSGAFPMDGGGPALRSVLLAMATSALVRAAASPALQARLWGAGVMADDLVRLTEGFLVPG